MVLGTASHVGKSPAGEQQLMSDTRTVGRFQKAFSDGVPKGIRYLLNGGLCTDSGRPEHRLARG
jgi:hypothetical protein